MINGNKITGKTRQNLTRSIEYLLMAHYTPGDQFQQLNITRDW
jgi:hypothetical protein